MIDFHHSSRIFYSDLTSPTTQKPLDAISVWIDSFECRWHLWLLQAFHEVGNIFFSSLYTRLSLSNIFTWLTLTGSSMSPVSSVSNSDIYESAAKTTVMVPSSRAHVFIMSPSISKPLSVFPSVFKGISEPIDAILPKSGRQIRPSYIQSV